VKETQIKLLLEKKAAETAPAVEFKLLGCSSDESNDVRYLNFEDLSVLDP
jgi:hypothetical protein